MCSIVRMWTPGIRQQFTDDFLDFGVIEIPAADGPVDDLPLCIQQQSCWKTLDAEACCDRTVQVKQNGKAGVNRQLSHKRKHVIFSLPFVNGKYGECFVFEGPMQGFHGGDFAAAGRAPGGPEIQYHNLAPVAFK